MLFKKIWAFAKSLFSSGVSVKTQKKQSGNNLNINQKGMKVHGNYSMKIDNSYQKESNGDLSDE